MNAFRFRFRLPGLGLCSALLVLCAIAPPAFADPASQVRPVGSFTSIRLSGPADLILRQGDATTLTVEGDAGDLDALKAEIVGDELRLSDDRHFILTWSGSKKNPTFVLTTASFDRLSVTGSGDVRCDSFILKKDANIALSGSGDATFRMLAVRKLTVLISGSGDMDVQGAALEQSIRISGSGDYRSAGLKTASAAVSVAGSGSATVWARDSLAASVAGSGDIRYYGTPAVSKAVAGSGEVIGLGANP